MKLGLTPADRDEGCVLSKFAFDVYQCSLRMSLTRNGTRIDGDECKVSLP